MSLSSQLFREVKPEFFRLLTGGLARLYLDALDALEMEASHRSHGLDREEALGLVEQVVEDHPDASPEPGDALASARTVREKARAILETFRRAGWIAEEENRTDYRQVIVFDINGVGMLHALRRIASPDLTVFSDKLLTVCVTLANREALLEQPWPAVESCMAGLEAGLVELRGMQKSIERHTRQQLAAGSLRENFEVLFDRFSERIGRTCYAQLVHARLLVKLADARKSLEDLGTPDIMEAMQTEVMRRQTDLSAEAAMARVRNRLRELSDLLDQVEPLADAIDRRTAEFTRRSHARSRYLQETTSENRGTVQTMFETLNRRFAGKKIAEIEPLGTDVPRIRIHEVRLPGGLESLFTPRLRREAGEMAPLDDAEDFRQDRALAQLEGTMRDSLTVNRANLFVQRLPGDAGSAVDSSKILSEHVHNDEDMAGLIACLLHARSSDARYRLEVPRCRDDSDTAEFDSKLGYRVERFRLIKR